MHINWPETIKSLIAGIVGGTGAFYLLFTFFRDWWMEKIRTGHSKEIESLKALIERSTFVTRAHFETEFESSKTVFKTLSEVRLSLSELRPQIRPERADETRESQLHRLSERMTSLQKAYNTLLEQTESMSPFYPADLYAALGKCLKVANSEILDVLTADAPGNEHPSFSFGWYKEGRLRKEEFQKAYDDVSSIIRERLSRLAVLPST